MKRKIRNWYMEYYPSDNLASAIKKDVIFEDLYNALEAKEDVYSLLGIYDSVIRERCFAELAILLNKDYDFVYELWLGGASA